MSDAPFIKFYPGDFLAGTSGLSPAERGVYITLLCLIYEMDGAIARDDTRLSRRCGAPKAAFVRILQELIDQKKITETDGMLSNRRAEKAIVDRTNRTQNAANAANARWTAEETKSQQNQAPVDTAALPQQSVADAIPEPEPEVREEKKGSNEPSRAKEARDAFPDFWDAFPHRNGKRNRAGAEKVFLRVVKAGATIEQIAEGVENMRRDPRVQAGFARDPTRWLNEKGWEDEFPDTPNSYGDHHDNRTGNVHGFSERPQNRPDSTLANCVRLAGLGRT